MMFNAARQSFLLSAVISVLFAALFAARYVLAPYPAEVLFTDGMPLAAALTGFSTEIPWLASVFAFVLVVWTLVVIMQLTLKYAPVTSRNYLPPQIFIVAAGGIVISGEALAALLAAWLLALSMRQFIFSLHKEFRFAEVFHAGFYLGMIPLLYAPMAAVAVFAAPVAAAIYRRSAREFVVCAVGLLLPVPAAGLVYWAAGRDAGFMFRELWRCAVESPATPGYTQIPLPAAAVAGSVLLLALIAVARSLTHKKNIRKTPYKFMTHVSFTLAALVASGALPGTSPTLVPLVAVPVALSIPYAFSGRWAVASSISYCLILAAVLTFGLLHML